MTSHTLIFEQIWDENPAADSTFSIIVLSFLGNTEQLTANKSLVYTLTEYCFHNWAGSPASNLSFLDSVESKAFNIIDISS